MTNHVTTAARGLAMLQMDPIVNDIAKLQNKLHADPDDHGFVVDGSTLTPTTKFANGVHSCYSSFVGGDDKVPHVTPHELAQAVLLRMRDLRGELNV